MFNGLRDVLAVPFGYALYVLYELTHQYLFSLFILTLVVRLILLPSAVKQQKNSAKQLRLQAKVNKIKAKYAGQQTRETQAKIQEETQELYKREGFSATAGGCLPLFIQFPVMIGLYGAIYSPLKHVLHVADELIETMKTVAETLSIKLTVGREQLDLLNNFSQISLDPTVAASTEIVSKINDFIAAFKIGSIRLTEYPNTFNDEGGNKLLLLIPILAGVTALLTSLLMYLRQRKTNPEMAKNPTMGCMTFMSPAMSAYFSYILPAGVGVYWIISNVISFVQTLILNQALKPEKIIAMQMIDETVERRSKENSLKLHAQQLAQEQ